MSRNPTPCSLKYQLHISASSKFQNVLGQRPLLSQNSNYIPSIIAYELSFENRPNRNFLSYSPRLCRGGERFLANHPPGVRGRVEANTAPDMEITADNRTTRGTEKMLIAKVWTLWENYLACMYAEFSKLADSVDWPLSQNGICVCAGLRLCELIKTNDASAWLVV